MDKFETTPSLIANVCHDIFLKCVSAATLIVVEFSFGDITSDILVALLVLIIFDFITAIRKLKTTGEEVESRKIFRTAWKIVLYYMLISAGHLTETIVGFNLFLDETILAFLAITELISILENIAHMGYAIPLKLLNKLKSIQDEK